jgi:hypothetical protein
VLLFQSILLASLSSGTLVASSIQPRPRPRPAPAWVTRLLSLGQSWNNELQLSRPCSRISGRLGSPCISLMPEQGLVARAPAGDYGSFELKLPRRGDAFRDQGGFVRLEMVESRNVRVGPELSWSTPDSPREDLPKMRLLSPGWGVRIAWGASRVAVGVSACSRFVMVGRGLPLVDPLTSEARIEFRLP